MNAKPPYGRLSSFYFFYFATLGILVPYWGLYLPSLNFNPREIGELLAILVGTKLIAPYLWGWIADHTGKRIMVVRIGSFLAALSFLLVYGTTGYWGMAGVMMLYSFFWNAVLPQYEATTMNHLGEDHHRYSVLRSWGSIGFIALVLLLGPMIDREGTDIIIPFLVLTFTMIWVSSMLTPADDGQIHSDDVVVDKVVHIVLRPEVISLFAVCFLMQFSHGPYYAFYSIYMEGHGYSKTIIGQFWALGVIAEVFVFLVMSRLIIKFGARLLLIFSLMIAVVRWLMIAIWPQEWWLMFIAQTFHAATFGMYHAIAIYLIHHYFTGKMQGRGQALYSSISFGAGGALGSLVSGYTWDMIGGTGTYVIASAGVFIAVIIALIGVRDTANHKP
ncbi:MAG: MFS transporter [Gammaproteobacteria bacterium]|nr:MAG: MFS transporter [Gammaproteobacteria bacterium]